MKRGDEWCRDRADVFVVGFGACVEVRAIHAENEVGRKGNEDCALKQTSGCDIAVARFFEAPRICMPVKGRYNINGGTVFGRMTDGSVGGHEFS